MDSYPNHSNMVSASPAVGPRFIRGDLCAPVFAVVGLSEHRLKFLFFINHPRAARKIQDNAKRHSHYLFGTFAATWACVSFLPFLDCENAAIGCREIMFI